MEKDTSSILRKKSLLTRIAIVLLSFCWISVSQSQIILDNSNLNTSVSDKAKKAEDPDYSSTIEEIIKSDDLNYSQIDKPLDIIDFTSSRWIIKFEVQNPGEARSILFETARPITDRADLYEVDENKVVQRWNNGDMIPFDEKSIEHRKNLYELDFEKGETKSFYLFLESDGEVINLPMIFWEKEKFYQTDLENRVLHQLY